MPTLLTREEFMFDFSYEFFVSTCVLLGTTLLGVFAWVRARERALRAEAKLDALLEAARNGPNHLQAAVDAIAIEVERVSEGQRFVTKLLADREPAPSRALDATHGSGGLG